MKDAYLTKLKALIKEDWFSETLNTYEGNESYHPTVLEKDKAIDLYSFRIGILSEKMESDFDKKTIKQLENVLEKLKGYKGNKICLQSLHSSMYSYLVFTDEQINELFGYVIFRYDENV